MSTHVLYKSCAIFIFNWLHYNSVRENKWRLIIMCDYFLKFVEHNEK